MDHQIVLNQEQIEDCYKKVAEEINIDLSNEEKRPPVFCSCTINLFEQNRIGFVL